MLVSLGVWLKVCTTVVLSSPLSVCLQATDSVLTANEKQLNPNRTSDASGDSGGC